MTHFHQRDSRNLAIACLMAIPIDCVLGINSAMTTSAYRYGPWIVLAWVFAIIDYRGRPHDMRPRISRWQLARRWIHRASFLLTIVCLCMIPISLLVEAKEWGRFPDGYQMAAFMYSWIFAAVNECSRTAKPAQKTIQNDPSDNPLEP